MNNVESMKKNTPIVHNVATELAAIRSAAEILHDFPEIGDHERKRFVEIVLTSEKRLESLLLRLSPRGEKGLA